ncbi:MAG: hypothetical protein J0I77_01830 [Rudaea sp.]|uniref:hypothetical protein n=1 Tax=unclassified Rudaea TaxID=2627037 RepID=UPI0010F79601|nr:MULTISPECIES: hypothetical protein [unclassified Rudaea]MBN8884434.1 hypothetical protein [Rudaea sp.]
MSQKEQQPVKKLQRAIEQLAHVKGIELRDALGITCRMAVTALTNALHQARSAGSDEYGLAALPEFDFGFFLEERNVIDEPSVEAASAYLDAVVRAEPFADILGDMHQHSIGSRQLAQFFTPPNLATGAARFLDRATPMRPTLYEVLDPSCGAGALLLAHIRRRLQVEGSAGVWGMVLQGNDLDPLCSLMTATQIFANEIAHGVVVGVVYISVGDGLTLEGPPLHWSMRRDVQQHIAGLELLRRLGEKERRLAETLRTG